VVVIFKDSVINKKKELLGRSQSDLDVSLVFSCRSHPNLLNKSLGPSFLTYETEIMIPL
jgi:hypothetical protein